MLVENYSREEIFEKQLYPYIPYYFLRYERKIRNGTEKMEEVIEDLEYFRNKLQEHMEEGKLTLLEYENLKAYINSVLMHLTNGNQAEERLVKIMGGKIIETEADRIKTEGELVKLIKLVCKKILKGCSPIDTADMLEEDEETIIRIYEIAEHYAPDYEADAIYAELQKSRQLV